MAMASLKAKSNKRWIHLYIEKIVSYAVQRRLIPLSKELFCLLLTKNRLLINSLNFKVNLGNLFDHNKIKKEKENGINVVIRKKVAISS